MSTNEAEPLTDAELDMLATLDAKRTPGPLAAHVYGPLDAWVRVAATTEAVVHCGANVSNGANDARAIAAALNALPALLAEVRRGRLAAVEVRAVATALAEHEPCLACGCEEQEDTCLYHESHDLSARLLAAMGVAK